MRVIADNYSGPCLAIGDFNDVISSTEKSGGRSIYRNRVNAYKDMVDDCGFIDLGFTGSHFTWLNKRQGPGLIKQRLDRAWASPS